MTDLRIELATVNSSQQLHDLLAAVFGFPDYYGHNSDAFDECIDDFGPEDGEIVVTGWDQMSQRLSRDAHRLREILTHFAESRRSVRVVWQTSASS